MKLIQHIANSIDQADLWHKTISLTRGEYLKVNGSTDTNLYYVLSGSLKISFEDEFDEQILRLGYQGNIIGALDSFISEQPSDLYIQALKATALKAISKTAFRKWIAMNEENRTMWQSVTELLIYEQIEREKDILTQSPLARYQRVLKRSPQLFQEIPNKYIASYLRMTPETLSRIKSGNQKH